MSRSAALRVGLLIASIMGQSDMGWREFVNRGSVSGLIDGGHFAEAKVESFRSESGGIWFLVFSVTSFHPSDKQLGGQLFGVHGTYCPWTGAMISATQTPIPVATEQGRMRFEF